MHRTLDHIFYIFLIQGYIFWGRFLIKNPVEMKRDPLVGLHMSVFVSHPREGPLLAPRPLLELAWGRHWVRARRRVRFWPPRFEIVQPDYFTPGILIYVTQSPSLGPEPEPDQSQSQSQTQSQTRPELESDAFIFYMDPSNCHGYPWLGCLRLHRTSLNLIIHF